MIQESYEETLSSGAILKMNLASFADGKALYMTMCEEGMRLNVDPYAQVDFNFWKNLLLMGLSSRKIEAALWKCMARVTYKSVGGSAKRIDTDTFETEEARGDYLEACFEVARYNILPFTKNRSGRLTDRLTETAQALQSLFGKTISRSTSASAKRATAQASETPEASVHET